MSFRTILVTVRNLVAKVHCVLVTENSAVASIFCHSQQNFEFSIRILTRSYYNFGKIIFTALCTMCGSVAVTKYT